MKQIFTLVVFFGAMTAALSQELKKTQIENDLYSSYQKIVSLQFAEYGAQYNLLAFANNQFADKIEKYTSLFPTTLTSKFDSLRKNIFITDSEDQLMRIFSWNTMTGGSRPYFANIFQYKVGTNVFSKTAYNKSYLKDGRYQYATEPKIFPFYSQIFTLEATHKTYYLGIYNNIYSGKEASQSIKILTIDGNTLTDSIALIKTKNGLVNEIKFPFNFFNLSDRPERPFQLIKYDSEQKIISIPTLDNDGNLSDTVLLYKFTGTYFELLETPKNTSSNEVGIGFVAQRNPEFPAHDGITIFRDSTLTKEWNTRRADAIVSIPKSNIHYYICLEKTDQYYKILVNKNEIAYVPTAEIIAVCKLNWGNGIVDTKIDQTYDFKTWETVFSEAGVSRLHKENPIVKDLNDQSQTIKYDCGYITDYEHLSVNKMHRDKHGAYWLYVSFNCEDSYPDFSTDETKTKRGWIQWRKGNKLLIALSFQVGC